MHEESKVALRGERLGQYVRSALAALNHGDALSALSELAAASVELSRRIGNGVDDAVETARSGKGAGGAWSALIMLVQSIQGRENQR